MTEFSHIGKSLILIGFFIIVSGLGIILLSKIGFGRLPGDLVMRKTNFTFYFPIVSSIVLSLVLTIILNFLIRR
jgi:Protein of unknown function (DUF2905)